MADTRPAVGHIWRFANCELDERRRELRVRGIQVHIEAKPFELLLTLLLHAGEVVTKTELLDAVWPGIMVVDGSLATAISKIRKLLGDDEEIVVTVPRVGYKLGVPVHFTPVTGSPWPDLQLQPGDRVPGRDQWRLSRRLELSPSSEVWLAEHLKTREARVFKFALGDLHLRCLKREVTIARLLRESLGPSPEFVRVLEWNFDTSPCFIESEYGGPNLAEWAEAQGGLVSVPLDVRLKLVADAARAVAAAHALDILHKDLKPGNVLVSSDSQGTPRVTIADFGSASLLVPSRLSAHGITNLGFTQSANGEGDPLTGTAMYLAPEVLTGQAPTASSDVYALGVLLYQLVVGDFRRPFAPGWEADVADPLLRDDIAAAACGDPARRCRTAAELADRLENLDRRRQERNEADEYQRLQTRSQAVATARHRLLALAALAMFATAVAVAIMIYSRSTPTRSPLKTVAVLPFENSVSDPEVDFLRIALPDDVVTTLSRAEGLAVRPFSSTGIYREDADVQSTGRAVGADTVIRGHIRKVNDQLRITLEAVDVANNAVLWRDTVESPAENLIAIHMQLALAVRGGLVPALGASVRDAPPEPRNEEAYELYLKSLALAYDPAPNPQARTMLERAVALDPTYAPAWVALARRYYVDGHFESGDPAMLERARTAAERAVALAPDDVNAVAVLVGHWVERGALTSAHARARDLVHRRPDNATAQFLLSYVLRYAGLLEESAGHCEKAFLSERQPVNTTLRSCSVVFFVRGDFARAVNYLNLDRQSEVGKAFRIDMLVRQGDTNAALDLGLPQLPQWRAKYALLFACIRGQPASELARLAAAVRPAIDAEENYFSAAYLSYCGQTSMAAEMLRKAIAGNYCSFPAMETDPLFAPLRAAPEYAAVRAAGRACRNRFLAERDPAGS